MLVSVAVEKGAGWSLMNVGNTIVPDAAAGLEMGQTQGVVLEVRLTSNKLRRASNTVSE